MTSLREAIRAADDRTQEPAATPEWPDVDGSLYLKAISAAERIAVSNRIPDDEAARDIADELAFLVIKGTVDEAGEQVFDDSDAGWLRDKSGAVVHRLARRLQELAGLTNSQVEDERKNLPDSQTEPSLTSSPEPLPEQ